MLDFERQTPDEDDRLITVNGLNMPEFPVLERDDDSYPDISRIVTVMTGWVDMTLAANLQPGKESDNPEVPDTLWVPTKSGIIQMLSTNSVVQTQQEENISMLGEDYRMVDVTKTTVRRSIAQGVKRVSTSLDQLLVHEDIMTSYKGYSWHDDDTHYTLRRIGDVSISSNGRGWYAYQTYYNNRTEKSPNAYQAEKIALKAAANILALLGYKETAFKRSSRTYGDYLAELVK